MAAVKTTAITETVVVMETIAIAARILQIFRKKAIIATRHKTATIMARAFKKNDATSFNKKKKYIQINGNIAAFPWGKEEIALAGVQKR